MVLGTLGSTLNDELNRLANGGTYRDSSAMVDEALAAKQWANRENISPYSTDTVGVLNEIAGLGLDKKNWLDFNGICNYIAGTSGLPAAAALRQIYPTTDLLTGVASYYTDAATPTNWGSLGYVYFPYSLSSYLSVPDSSSLDITGDIDIRVKTSMDDWTPSVQGGFIFKDNSTGNNRSWQFRILTTGVLYFSWSPDGSTMLAASSTVANTITDGSVKWIRVTLDVDNGASGRDIKFWTSDDNITWTQLGTTLTQAGTTSIYSGNAAVEIGAAPSPGLGYAGNFYQAQVYASLNGTDKRLDVNIATDWKASELASFTATTGGTVYPVGIGTISNLGTAGSLLPTTMGSSYSADSNDPIFLAHTGTNYVYLPGRAADYLEVPDAAALDISGDIDLRWYGALDDWTPAVQNELLAKQTLSNRSYKIAINSTGFVTFQWSSDGSTVTTATSSVVTGVTDGAAKWVRATMDVDNGASGNDVKFYLSDNGSTWTQLGTTVTNAGVTTLYVGTAPVRIGCIPDIATTPLTGKIYRAQIYSDITETTKVLDVDTSVITAGSATSFTAVTGQTVTINRSTSGRKTVAVTQPTWLFGTDDYMEVNNRYMAHSTSDENYVYLSGVTGNNMTVADSPPLDITGDLDIQVKVAMDDWTPAGTQRLVSKYSTSDNQRSYSLYVTSTGYLELAWSNNGTTAITKTSTVTPTVTDGGTLWVRATLDIDNGAAGNDVKFYTSTDGTTWTQLGSTVTTAGTTSVYSGSATLFIGDYSQVNQSAKGKFYRAIIKNGIDGTTVLDANAAVITLPSQTTFVDSSSNAYTVTINKSGVGTFVSTGNYLYLPGVATNYASAPDAAPLDITGDIDIRVKLALDDWTPGTTNNLLSKYGGAGTRSYLFVAPATGRPQLTWSTDGTATVSAQSSTAYSFVDGETNWLRVTLDVDNGASGNDTKFFTSTDGITWTQLGTTITTAGVTSIFAGTAQLEVGMQGNTNGPARGKFFRAQVLNGIGGTVAFDANFEGSITSLTQASFTESSSNAATVTINRSGSTYRSAGVIDAGYLYPGATNTFSNSTIDYLNFGASDSFTALAVVRQWNSATAGGRYVNKGDTTGPRWAVFGTTGLQAQAFINDGTNSATSTISSSLTNGALSSFSMVIDRVAQTNTSYNSATAVSPVSTSSVGSVSSVAAFRVGSSSNSSVFQDFEFVAAAVFRQALTATQIRQITNYFANREAYL